MTAMGLKTVILPSGGDVAFSGTDRYSNPELAWDNSVLEKLAAQKAQVADRLRRDRARRHRQHRAALLGLRGAGALGERKPDIVSMGPELAPQLRVARLVSPPGNGHAAALSVDRLELVELYLGAAAALAHEEDSRTGLHQGCRRLCGPLQAVGRAAPGADRDGPAGDRQDGRASRWCRSSPTCKIHSGCGGEGIRPMLEALSTTTSRSAPRRSALVLAEKHQPRIQTIT